MIPRVTIGTKIQQELYDLYIQLYRDAIIRNGGLIGRFDRWEETAEEMREAWCGVLNIIGDTQREETRSIRDRYKAEIARLNGKLVDAEFTNRQERSRAYHAEKERQEANDRAYKQERDNRATSSGIAKARLEKENQSLLETIASLRDQLRVARTPKYTKQTTQSARCVSIHYLTPDDVFSKHREYMEPERVLTDNQDDSEMVSGILDSDEIYEEIQIIKPKRKIRVSRPGHLPA